MSFSATLFVAAFAAFPVRGDAGDPAGPDNGPDKDIVQTAVAAGSFKTLVAALQAGGLVEALRGEGPFTVFAPTDQAFAKLPEGTLGELLKPENKARLVDILTYHVVPGRVTSLQALQAGTAATLQKSELEFSLAKGQLLVSGRRVVQNDIQAKNGVIHVIDHVLIPEPKQAPYERLTGAGFIGFAVERGASLYNAGDREACVAIYEVAIRALLDLDEALLKAKTRRAIKASLAKADGQSDALSKAWTLRHAIDRAWRELSDAEGKSKEASMREATTPSGSTKALFEFSGEEPAWFSVNDDVMGGVSRAGFQRSGRGTAVFSGALSLENNGGFATIRSPRQDFGLDGYEGVIVRLLGDGRSYWMSALKSDRRWETRTWQARFDTKAGEWTEIRIPFNELKLRVMGRWIKGAKPIRPSDIGSFSFGIADKDERPFRLEIDSIRAYRAASAD